MARDLRASLALAVLVLAGSACPRSARLAPAPAANQVGDHSAVDRVEDVYVEIGVERWPGEETALKYVTPVRVRLVNMSEHPVRVRQSSFAILAPEGEQFAALSPGEFRRGVFGGAEPERARSILVPRFDYYDLGIEPYLDTALPALETNRYPLGWSIQYAEAYSNVWAHILPTTLMLELAMPVGILEPGGEIEGFVYFEKVPQEGRPIVFVLDLVDASTGRSLGVAEIPLVRGE